MADYLTELDVLAYVERPVGPNKRLVQEFEDAYMTLLAEKRLCLVPYAANNDPTHIWRLVQVTERLSELFEFLVTNVYIERGLHEEMRVRAKTLLLSIQWQISALYHKDLPQDSGVYTACHTTIDQHLTEFYIIMHQLLRVNA